MIKTLNPNPKLSCVYRSERPHRALHARELSYNPYADASNPGFRVSGIGFGVEGFGFRV